MLMVYRRGLDVGNSSARRFKEACLVRCVFSFAGYAFLKGIFAAEDIGPGTLFGDAYHGIPGRLFDLIGRALQRGHRKMGSKMFSCQRNRQVII